MTTERFDVCIVGAGPAGYAAAMRAHDLGRRVLLVERDRVGGTGIHHGALSSKTLWHLSNDYANACRTDRGYVARDIAVSYEAVMNTVTTAVTCRREQLTLQICRLAEPAPNGGQVTFVQGTARFVTRESVEVTAPDGGRTAYTADNFLVATGSRPRLPAGIEVDGEFIVTSDHIESLQDFPASMVVVGAGVVGCEYATMFAHFGKTKISLIDTQPRILPFEDEDVAEVIATGFERMGITIHRQSKLVSLKRVDGMVEYVIADPAGVLQTYRVERALVSIGRVPNTGDLGLAALGVEVDRSGGVVVQHTRSTVPNIYAAGDTTLDIALVNVAELEGRHAVERMFGLSPDPLNYETLSAIMFLSPEVASVGLNEQQARQKGIPYRVAVLNNQLINRNIAMRSTTGFIKLLASREEPGRLLGLRVVGPQASSTIQGIAFLIDQQGTLEDIDHCIHPHPAIPEGVQECARILLGRSIHKSEVFGPSLVRCGQG